MNKFYTGVGARKTPTYILELMTDIAQCLYQQGYVLRSGGAEGADRAFELGAGNLKEIYLAKHATKEAMEIASKFHRAWHKCSQFAKALHGRNAFQVLGHSLGHPSEFLICWTPDGCNSHLNRDWITGGTGTAISIAWANGVPILNLCRPEIRQQWINWVK